MANWKMNPSTLEEAMALMRSVRQCVRRLRTTRVVVCPPLVYIAYLKHFIKGGRSQKLCLGAQNLFYGEATNRTGEVSGAMIVDVGASYVIVGHSERRALGDSPEIVNKKVLSALGEGLKVILCVGEGKRDPEGEFLNLLEEDLRVTLRGVSRRYKERIIIAYEPIYAIGKGEDAALVPEAIREMAIFIQKVAADLFGQNLSSQVEVIYGGSVARGNASRIVGEGSVSGLLIGRESLSASDFKEILMSVDTL